MTSSTGAIPWPAKAFAAIGWLAAVIGAIGAITLRIVDPAPILPSTFGFGDVALVGFEVMGVAFASVGGLLVVRRPRNAVGWCMVLIGVGYADGGLTAAATYSAAATGTAEGLRLAGVMGWLTTVLTTIGGLIFALPFIFPTGRGHDRLWDRLIRISIIPWALVPLVLTFQPGPLHVFSTIDNPFGFGPDLRTVLGLSFSQLITVGAVTIAPVVVVSFASRYRSSGHVERQQLKWFLLASIVMCAGVGLASAGAVFSKEPPTEAGLAIFGFAGAVMPVAIGIAILRYRLYDIDRVISRTLGYALVTGLLAAVLAGMTLLLQSLLTPYTQGQTVAVALSTLLVFARFQPVRQRIQRAVDRRFDRAHYDADRTIESLADRLRVHLDLATVSQEIARTADVAVRPTSVSVWLRPSERTASR
jgi:hypothetical protein